MSGLNKTAIITSIIGLVFIAVVIISGSSYPDPLFSYGTAIGLLMCFVAILLYIANWCREVFVSIKNKNIVGILILIFTAILFVSSFIKN